jgi:hypothetical protein
MPELNPFNDKIFNFDDRLVRFAGECIFFTRKLDKSYEKTNITKINSFVHQEVLL